MCMYTSVYVSQCTQCASFVDRTIDFIAQIIKPAKENETGKEGGWRGLSLVRGWGVTDVCGEGGQVCVPLCLGSVESVVEVVCQQRGKKQSCLVSLSANCLMLCLGFNGSGGDDGSRSSSSGSVSSLC